MISLDSAQKAIEKAVTKAQDLGITVTVTVVDDHGTLIAASKMDGALNISPKYSYAKAFTSANLGLPTADIAGYAIEGKPYFGTTSAFGGELMVIAGGLPVKKGGKVIGAVGVGGSADVNQDVECAKAAAEVLGKD
ncbi:MAG: hypothetical protein UU34_C0001G0083 [Candidatus Curtissbacteria bacterium GW2011_GWA1_41_11]|uniref:ATP/cobalamin adenosyltransferase n=1 Tax=Candidatus Curtissbacteria bacterium GW2011_GWA1_41_11 TaxID=1618409 RepID=A0A0G0UKQ5_9BACT|nr:MAG: hypothetical protein UU34_C0001G0083 [Candidatus Curtissbacteria bacterium GW2011_GWA1_41_11]